jgi:NAD(P)-dependent dehydrogenase (short-subunit alcohol dehydrogenase family)
VHLELGATVYICGRRRQVPSQAEVELSRVAPSKIRSLPCDIRDLPRVEEMIKSLWDDGPLDILVNNAAGNFLARTEPRKPPKTGPGVPQRVPDH